MFLHVNQLFVLSYVHFHPLGYDAAGCIQLEYTRISFGDRLWYSFGLEWLVDSTAQIPEAFFARLFEEKHLSRDKSMGYPAFLKEAAIDCIQ